MRIKIYFFGKKTEIDSREKELLKRINYRFKAELIPISQAGISDIAKNKSKEAENFLKKISKQDFVIAFDEHGQQLDSIKFATWLQKKITNHQQIIFIIGGAYGLDQTILKRANFVLSFGKMVWTRNLFRQMTVEQIYRAVEINSGSNFHK